MVILKSRRNYRKKTKKIKFNSGVQQIVKINIGNKKRRKYTRRQPQKKTIPYQPYQQQITLNPKTKYFDDNIMSHKLSVLEIEELETKNNLKQAIEKAQFMSGIEGDKYMKAIEAEHNQLKAIEGEIYETQTDAGKIFGRIGTRLTELEKKTNLYTPPESARKALPEPTEEHQEEEGGASSSGGQTEETGEPEEEEPTYKFTSFTSSFNRLVGETLQRQIDDYLRRKNISKKEFLQKMYASTEIGMTSSVEERKAIINRYLKKIFKK